MSTAALAEARERIWAAAKVECDRQHVGPDRVVMLVDAYHQAQTLSAGRTLPTVEVIERLVGVLEPDSGGRMRRVPVTFDEGGSAAAPERVEPTMRRMFDLLDPDLDADEFVRSFLSVHPFTDGNGRSAWLLRTWLTGTWDEPEPLPDYGW